jgi:hypothetical protein
MKEHCPPIDTSVMCCKTGSIFTCSELGRPNSKPCSTSHLAAPYSGKLRLSVVYERTAQEASGGLLLGLRRCLSSGQACGDAPWLGECVLPDIQSKANGAYGLSALDWHKEERDSTRRHTSSGRGMSKRTGSRANIGAITSRPANTGIQWGAVDTSGSSTEE